METTWECGNDLVTSVNNLLTCGNDLVTSGNNLLTCGKDLVTSGNNLLTCGNDFLTCGNDLYRGHPSTSIPFKFTYPCWLLVLFIPLWTYGYHFINFNGYSSRLPN